MARAQSASTAAARTPSPRSWRVRSPRSSRTPRVAARRLGRAFSKTGEVLVGQVAKRQVVTNARRTIRSVKRHLGTDWTIDTRPSVEVHVLQGEREMAGATTAWAGSS